MRIVIRLLYQTQLLTLRLVQATLHTKGEKEAITNLISPLPINFQLTISPTHLYASLSLSRAKMSSFVSCL